MMEMFSNLEVWPAEKVTSYGPGVKSSTAKGVERQHETVLLHRTINPYGSHLVE